MDISCIYYQLTLTCTEERLSEKKILLSKNCTNECLMYKLKLSASLNAFGWNDIIVKNGR